MSNPTITSGVDFAKGTDTQVYVAQQYWIPGITPNGEALATYRVWDTIGKEVAKMLRAANGTPLTITCEEFWLHNKPDPYNPQVNTWSDSNGLREGERAYRVVMKVKAG